MRTHERYNCERCGEGTSGDALCAACLSELEQAVHPPFARQPVDVRADMSTMVARIRDRLREHLAQRPPCPHCAGSPSLVLELLDAEQASAEILLSLDTLAKLSRDPRFALDPGALDVLADAARRWHEALSGLAARLGALAMGPV
jgi:hypothetical protein